MNEANVEELQQQIQQLRQQVQQSQNETTFLRRAYAGAEQELAQANMNLSAAIADRNQVNQEFQELKAGLEKADEPADRSERQAGAENIAP